MSLKRHLKGIWSLCRLTAGYDGGLQKKLKYLNFARIARKSGVVPFRIDRVASEFVDAWYAVKDMDASEKLWYITHGFNPNRKAWYGVTPDNYRSFVSEFEFYRDSSYVNIHFSSWFDDKLTTYRILQPFKNDQPRHFFYLKQGGAHPLDFSTDKLQTAETIVNLAKESALALKRCEGGHGDGFMKVHFNGDKYYLNDKEITYKDLVARIASLDGYIVTEFIKPHASLRAIAGEDNFSVLRVISVCDPEDGPQVIGIIVRIGTTQAGHTQAGHDHFYMNVDIATGQASDAVFEHSDYCFEKITKHPETGESLDNVIIPDIEDIVCLVKKVSSFLSMTPYLVFDIVPTDNGPKILEINSHGQPFIVDQYIRVKQNEYFAKLFKKSLD